MKGKALLTKEKPTMKKPYMRRVILRPYLKGMGPTFSLTLWDYHCSGSRDYISYSFGSSEGGLLFEGSDFSPSPCYAVDSDKAVRALLGFLTLKPGDTDEEYFENYTADQLAFAQAHGEAVDCEAMARFGED